MTVANSFQLFFGRSVKILSTPLGHPVERVHRHVAYPLALKINTRLLV
jgi:hypothetical protein